MDRPYKHPGVNEFIIRGQKPTNGIFIVKLFSKGDQ